MKSLKEKSATNTIQTISLFSGAGGLDIGAIYAGAQILWANDMKKDACESYAQNIGNHIHQGDINSLLPSLSDFSDRDLLIGGPPCQGFSVAGKMDVNDERSQLVWSYAKAIELVHPKAFVMENVKALATLGKWANIRTELLRRFQQLGYSVNFIVLNGSPSERTSLFHRVQEWIKISSGFGKYDATL